MWEKLASRNLVRNIQLKNTRKIIESKKKNYSKLGKKLSDPHIGVKSHWSILNKLIHKKKFTNIPPILENGLFVSNLEAKAMFTLLRIRDYRTQNIAEGLDWESIQNKYSDIAERMEEALRKYNERNGSGKDYKQKPEEITKEKVATKLKAVRKKYRIAVDSGKKSGHGRVILLYFEECEAIWGGSPATTKIKNGIESSVIEESQDSSSANDVFPLATEESDSDETSFSLASSSGSAPPVSSTPAADGVNKRRALLDETLAKHKKQKLQKKCSVESQFLCLAKEELELKKDMIQQQKQIDEDYKETMSTLAGVMENLSKSISDGFGH